MLCVCLWVAVCSDPTKPNTQSCPLNHTMIPLFVVLKMIRGDDKEKVAKEYGRRLLKIKNSLEAPSLFLLIHYAPKLLPNCLFEAFYKFMAKKPSFGFTNVPGPLNQLKYMDSFAEKIFFYVPSVNRIGLGFSLMTYNNNLMFSIQADEKTRVDPEEFCNQYQHIMDVYIEHAMTKNSPEKSPEKSPAEISGLEKNSKKGK